ncbi:hypothetical protein AB833_12015 [Chromatiales bacterium (ex Bugula neritina AB1)]|nr:hypothetical protein AB833_12015 [Chromatiales bacterium (ex Bugula neritina AB1)]
MSNRSPPKPTIKTIAELTGLSMSTVSLSLRDGSNLKQSTRDKVARTAAQIGYVPNRAGVRLRTGRTNVLSLVLAADVKNMDFTRILIQGIGSHILGSKYHLNVVPEFERRDPEESIRYILDNRSADGVILTHTSARDSRVQLLMDADFPFVSHGRTEFYSPHAYHDFHAERYVELAVERLLQKGRRKILLAVVDNGTTNYSNTVNAFNRAIAKSKAAGDTLQDSSYIENTDAARLYGSQLASRPDLYDAIICNNELTTLAIVSGLLEAGVTLGKEYDLICKQTTEILPVLYPAMDTIAEDLFETGNELARLLIDRINGNDVKTLQTLHEPIARWRS